MSLAAKLTGREMARVYRVTGQRIPRDTNRTREEYTAELLKTARELYPNKVS